MTVYVSLDQHRIIILTCKKNVYILWALQHNDSVCISQHNSNVQKKCMYYYYYDSKQLQYFIYSLYNTSLFEHVALVGVQCTCNETIHDTCHILTSYCHNMFQASHSNKCFSLDFWIGLEALGNSVSSSF